MKMKLTADLLQKYLYGEEMELTSLGDENGCIAKIYTIHDNGTEEGNYIRISHDGDILSSHHYTFSKSNGYKKYPFDEKLHLNGEKFNKEGIRNAIDRFMEIYFFPNLSVSYYY